MKNKFLAKMPAGTSDFSPIQGRMQKISQIVRLVSEIFLTEAHYIWVTKGLGTGPLPRPRNINWAKPRTN